jgi:integrase
VKQKLTLNVVKDAAPKAHRYVIWDLQPAGFGLRVNGDGTKTYVLKYAFKGRQRWHTIGRHGSPWAVDQARKEAMRLLGRVHEGQDLAAAKAAEKARSLTISDLCQMYLAAAEADTLISRRGQGKKPSTLATDRGRIERHIIPLLGRKAVKDVTRRDIEVARDAIASGKTAVDVKTGPRGRAIVKGGKGAATRTLGLLGGIFAFGVEMGSRADNPVHGVRRFKDQPKERYLSEAEIQKLGQVCADAEAASQSYHAEHDRWIIGDRRGPAPSWPSAAENPYAVAAIRLLLLTGMRKSEALTLRWDWVDFERGIIRLPDSKTGQRLVPLGAAAADLLKAVPRHKSNPHVFCGHREGLHLVGLPKIWERIRKRAGLDDVRLHDLRHSYASYGAASGISLYVLGKMLGHSDAKTTQRYAHLGDNPLISGANLIAGGLAELLVA